jgi:O-antigen ligase
MLSRKSITLIISSFVTTITAALAFMSAQIAMAFFSACAVIIIIFLNQFYGLIIYLVYSLLSPGFFIPLLSKLRVVFFLACILLLSFIMHRIVQRKPIQFLSTIQDKLMFVMLLLVPISSLSNFHLEAAWEGLNEFLTVYLLYLMITRIVDSYAKFRALSWFFVCLLVFLSINGIIQFFRGADLFGVPPLLGFRVRWVGHYGDPNDFACLLVSFFPFGLVSVFEAHVSVVRRIAFLLIIAAFIGAIYYTNSRGGFVAFLALIAFFSYRKWGIIKGTVIGGILFLAAIMYSPSRMGQISAHEASAAGRIDQWINGFAFFMRRPIFGIGFQRFEVVNRAAAHSAYVNCFTELGLVGYFVWLALIYTCIVGLRRAESRLPDGYTKYARILELSFVGYLVGSLFLSLTYTPFLFILLALSSVLINLQHDSIEAHGEPFARQLLAVAAIEVLSIVAIKGFIIVGY